MIRLIDDSQTFKKKKRIRTGIVPSGYKEIDGILYPRVTEIKSVIRKQWIVDWTLEHGKEGAKKITDEANQFGTDFHYRMAHYLTSQDDSLIPKVMANFLNEIKIKPVKIETEMVSQDYLYCGTPDCVADTKDGLCLIDWKTSKDIYYDQAIQLAAYNQLCKENSIFPYYAMIVRMPKDTDDYIQYSTIPCTVLDKVLFPTFLACKQIFDWEKNFTLKKIKFKLK